MNDNLEVIFIVVQGTGVVKMANVLMKLDRTPEGGSPSLSLLLDSWLLPTSVVVGNGYNIPLGLKEPLPALSSLMVQKVWCSEMSM